MCSPLLKANQNSYLPSDQESESNYIFGKEVLRVESLYEEWKKENQIIKKWSFAFNNVSNECQLKPGKEKVKSKV